MDHLPQGVSAEPTVTKGSQDDAGKYEVLRVVNRGGMGEIALGRVRGAKGFEKLVVLKRLRADAEREDHRNMFDVEAELMSRIEHPNIVQVFDQPTIGGIQYLAMAYVQGRNLDQVLRKAKQDGAQVTPEFALTVVCEMLRGLAFVHRLKDSQGRALGVVHQDITPSNVMLSFFGEVKITDFGIAYVTSRDGGRRKGVLKGKPRYVAPEVLGGKRVNNRADIYGTAVVLFELLTGRPLFARTTLDETLAAVARNELPDFRQTLSSVSAGVHRIMYKALAKDPNDRYRTAEEMHKELAKELNSAGGALSGSQLGYLARKWFQDAPDVPDIDPSLDESAFSSPARQMQKALDLQSTLDELDRLLGSETGSADVFDLPPEIQQELEEIEDGDPFAALTPIPELALTGPNGEELLMKAMLKEPGSLGLEGVGSGDVSPRLPAFPGTSTSNPGSAVPAELKSPNGLSALNVDDADGLSALKPEDVDPAIAARTARRNLGATGEYTFTPATRRSKESSDLLEAKAAELDTAHTLPPSAPVAGAPGHAASSTVDDALGIVTPSRTGFLPGLAAGLVVGVVIGLVIGWKLLG